MSEKISRLGSKPLGPVLDGASPLSWLGDLALGVGGNIAWDTIKGAYSKLKFELGRRIDPANSDFRFEGSDILVEETLDVIAGAGRSALSSASNLLRRSLANLPEALRRPDVRNWLSSAQVRRSFKTLTRCLLSSQTFEPSKRSLLQSWIEATGDESSVADHNIRVVIQFIGNTIEQSVSVGEGLVLMQGRALQDALREEGAQTREHVTRELSRLLAASAPVPATGSSREPSLSITKRKSLHSGGPLAGSVYDWLSQRARPCTNWFVLNAAHLAEVRERMSRYVLLDVERKWPKLPGVICLVGRQVPHTTATLWFPASYEPNGRVRSCVLQVANSSQSRSVEVEFATLPGVLDTELTRLRKVLP